MKEKYEEQVKRLGSKLADDIKELFDAHSELENGNLPMAAILMALQEHSVSVLEHYAARLPKAQIPKFIDGILVAMKKDLEEALLTDKKTSN